MHRTAAVFLSIMIAGCSPEKPATAQTDFQPRPNYLTMGNAAAGRTAFLELKCNACHDVAGERGTVKVPSSNGPELGTAEAALTPDEIARAIAAPGHSISKKTGPWRESGGSTMTDYAERITVRQLMDMIAYIRSLPGGKS